MEALTLILRSDEIKLKTVIPGMYCTVALLVWLDFMRLPPDGLANVGLMLVVLPVTILDLAVSPAASGPTVLMPNSFGYYANHTIFFVGSVAAIAAALRWIGSMLDRKR